MKYRTYLDYLIKFIPNIFPFFYGKSRATLLGWWTVAIWVVAQAQEKLAELDSSLSTRWVCSSIAMMRFLAFPRLTHNIWLPLEERACSSEWTWVRASPGSISCAFVLAAIYETAANTNWDSVIFCLRSSNWSWPIMPHHVPELNCTILSRCFVVMSSWIDGYKNGMIQAWPRLSYELNMMALPQPTRHSDQRSFAPGTKSVVCFAWRLSGRNLRRHGAVSRLWFSSDFAPCIITAMAEGQSSQSR